MKRKIAEEKIVKGLTAVRYEGDPPHRWHRLTLLTAAEKRERDRVRRLVEQELYEDGCLVGDESLSALGKLFRRARQTSSLSLTELAQKTGIEKAALSRIELGRNPNPSLRTLRRVARALGREVKITLPARAS